MATDEPSSSGLITATKSPHRHPQRFEPGCVRLCPNPKQIVVTTLRLTGIESASSHTAVQYPASPHSPEVQSATPQICRAMRPTPRVRFDMPLESLPSHTQSLHSGDSAPLVR